MAIDSRLGLVYSIAGPFLWEMRRPGHSRRCVLLKELLTLFLTFAKVGVMTFGGGYAMLPILQREVVENKGWTTDEELTDYFAIGQCTPGVIAVNTATFIGQKRRGILGGIVATLGVVFPSLVIIAALAGVIDAFSHLAWVQHAFAGIRVCVCADFQRRAEAVEGRGEGRVGPGDLPGDPGAVGVHQALAHYLCVGGSRGGTSH